EKSCSSTPAFRTHRTASTASSDDSTPRPSPSTTPRWTPPWKPGTGCSSRARSPCASPRCPPPAPPVASPSTRARCRRCAMSDDAVVTGCLRALRQGDMAALLILADRLEEIERYYARYVRLRVTVWRRRVCRYWHLDYTRSHRRNEDSRRWRDIGHQHDFTRM